MGSILSGCQQRATYQRPTATTAPLLPSATCSLRNRARAHGHHGMVRSSTSNPECNESSGPPFACLHACTYGKIRQARGAHQLRATTKVSFDLDSRWPMGPFELATRQWRGSWPCKWHWPCPPLPRRQFATCSGRHQSVPTAELRSGRGPVRWDAILLWPDCKSHKEFRTRL